MFFTSFNGDKTISFYENRPLAKPAQWSEEAVLTGEWGKATDAYLSDHVVARDAWLKLDTYLKCHVLQQPLIKNVVIGNNGALLPYLSEDRLDVSAIEKDLDSVAQNIVSVKAFTESHGGQFCYAAVPCQYVFHNDDYPWFMRNREAYTETVQAAFRARMAEEGVNYVDVGDTFAALDWDARYSSNIDNHTGIEGAYLSYRAITDALAGAGLDILEENEFTVETLPNPYFGSRVRSLMGMWESDEHLKILKLKEEIPFARSDLGKASEPFIYQLPDNDSAPVEYALYMGGDYAVTEIDTHRPELPDVLIYGDSFTNAVECVLYTGCNRMWSLDMRYANEGALEEYIATYEPDVVICLRDYEALLSPIQNGCGIASLLP